VKKILIGIVCTMLLGTVGVAAAPSIHGSTGMITTPSADVLQKGDFSIGYYKLEDARVGTFNMNIVKNVEIGVSNFNYDQRDNETYFSAKWALLPETVVTPGLAIGVEDIGDEDERSAYVVASKALPFGFRIHGGIGDGRYEKGFVALEKTINPLSIVGDNNTFPATTLIAEYDGDNFNYGARLSLVSGLKIDAGVRDHDFYFGASFTY